MTIANAKTDALLQKIKEPAILITSDQVVLFDGKVREKPVDKNEAREFLRSYGEAPVELVGAIVVANTATGKRAQGIQKSRIHFHPFGDDFITKYLTESNEALTGAGGFVVQNPLFQPYIASYEGSFDSIVGLSKDLLKQLSKEVGMLDIN